LRGTNILKHTEVGVREVTRSLGEGGREGGRAERGPANSEEKKNAPPNWMIR